MISIETVRTINKTRWLHLFQNNRELFRDYSRPCQNAEFRDLTNYLNNICFLNASCERKLNEFLFESFSYEQTNSHRIERIAFTSQLPINYDEFIVNNASILRIGNTFKSEVELYSTIEQQKEIDIQNLRDTEIADNERIFKIRNKPILVQSVATRDPDNHENLNQVSMLFKVASTTHIRNDRKNIFFNVTVDYKNKIMDIGYSKNLAEYNSPLNLQTIYNLILDYLNELCHENSLGVITYKFDEEQLKRVLYSLFSDISIPIEEELYNALPSDTNYHIQKFLKAFNLEEKDEKIRQLQAVIFQEYGDAEAKNFREGLYDYGFIFRFGFMQGKSTRIISRNENEKPIYTSPIYWNLKELIHREGKLFSVGVSWPLEIETENISNLTKLDIINSKIYIYYYANEHKNIGKERINHVRTILTDLLRKPYQP